MSGSRRPVALRLVRPSPRSLAAESIATLTSSAQLWRWQRRELWAGFGKPLNGQLHRQAIVRRLVEEFDPGFILETGTFAGFSTRWFAALGRDVYSVEVNPGYFHVARTRLRGLANVTLMLGDSVAGIRRVAEMPIERPLLYLDAHWRERVPLQEEIDAALARWDDAVIVIDDFRVPGDDGYAYDIYGGIALSSRNVQLPDDSAVAFPSLPAIQETGARRGSIVIGRGPGAERAVAACSDVLASAEVGRPSANSSGLASIR
jgi:predicted O-methyltransferase YrrM